jgi:hypothetical protein
MACTISAAAGVIQILHFEPKYPKYEGVVNVFRII